MGVGAYRQKSLISFMTVLVDGGGVGCVLQYARIIISLIRIYHVLSSGVFRIREIFIWTKLHFVCKTQNTFCLYRVWGYTTPHLPQNYSVRYTVYCTGGDDEAAAFMTPCAKNCTFCKFV